MTSHSDFHPIPTRPGTYRGRPRLATTEPEPVEVFWNERFSRLMVKSWAGALEDFLWFGRVEEGGI